MTRLALLLLLAALAACSNGTSSASVEIPACSGKPVLRAQENSLKRNEELQIMAFEARMKTEDPAWIDSVLYTNPVPLPPYPERFRIVQARVDSANCEIARGAAGARSGSYTSVLVPMADRYFVEGAGEMRSDDPRDRRDELLESDQEVMIGSTVGWDGSMREVKIIHLRGIVRTELGRLDLVSLARNVRMTPALEGGVPNAPTSDVMWSLDGYRSRRARESRRENEAAGRGARARSSGAE